jgi:hypothetical protein
MAVSARVRAWDYERAAAALRPERDRIYASVFPGATPPPGAALRVQSERIKLSGLTEEGGPALPAQTSGLAALEVLHTVSASIPEQMRLFVQEIVLEPGEVRLSGLTTSHEAAGEFVQAMNKLSDLEVEPPRTKLRPDKTVDFRMTARRKGEVDE